MMDPNPKLIVSSCCRAGIKMRQRIKCVATCKECGNVCRPLAAEYVEHKDDEKEIKRKKKEEEDKKKKGIW